MTTLVLRLIILFCLFWLPPFLTPVHAVDVYTFHGEDGGRYYTNKPGPGCKKVRLPLVVSKSGSGRVVTADRKMHDYESLIVQASETHYVDPDLIRAIIKVESNFNHRAVSPKGAQGLMQLMPKTARELGVIDPFEPAANIHGGVMYMRRLLDLLDGDLPLSLAAYNAGLERVLARKEIPAIPETKNYVKQVMNYYSRLKKAENI